MKIPIEEMLANEPEKLEILKRIGRTAERVGVVVYAVGGLVRDALLRRPNTDIDVMVEGDAIQFAESLAKDLGIRTVVRYERFATAILPMKDWNIEIASARREEYDRSSRKPRVESARLEEDLSRRDFTVNAMAVDIRPSTLGEFHDLFGGIKDMEIQTLRTPKDPDMTFFDDPLRMMRAIRFAAQLQYRIHPDTWESIRRISDRISIISMERIRDELTKILMSEKPSIGLILLKNSGLLDHFLPEFARLAGVEERDGYGHKDVLYHTAQVVDNICSYTEDPILRFAAMFHDIGKPPVKRFRRGTGWTYHGHEDLGAQMFEEIGRRLKLPIRDIKRITKLIRLHLRPIAIASEGVTDSAVRRLMVDAGDDIDDLLNLCRADITSQNQDKVKRFNENFDLVASRIRDVDEKDKMRNFKSPVDGNEIMQMFELKPGPGIGRIKSYLENEILEGNIHNDHESVMAWITENRGQLEKLIHS